ncbi:MAG: aspartate aminotransferase family protein [Alphaproteobacteria bacterium]|nr:aspartate aminotransferase family protein [Alphaproteobacteria bacterium]
MDQARITDIVQNWMIPTAEGAYMAGLETKPVIVSAKGSTMTDANGKTYLDFQSGQMGAALGHNHPTIAKSIRHSLETIVHSSNQMLNGPRLELHEKLGRIAAPLTRSLFLVSGSDSIEGTVDLARKATGGTEILGLHDSLHGSTSFVSRSLSFGWNRSKHTVVAPATSSILTPYCYRCPLKMTFPGCGYQCLSASMELADANFAGKPAAAIAEPILSAGGLITPPPGYFVALKKACAERGMLLIFDEAQTGLGKTGKMFAWQHEGVTPDIMALSKHFGGGLPISAVCTTTEVAGRAVANGFFATRSHATDPILCAAGAASLDVIIDEDLCGRAAAIEKRMKTAFTAMQKDVPQVGDIRGRGVLLGVEIVEDPETRVPANRKAKFIERRCLERGLIIQTRGSHGRANVIRFVPPMSTSDAEIDQGLQIFDEVLREAVGRNDL